MRLLKITILILSVSFLASCSITPKVNDRETISFDGNDQTAGIVQDFPDHSSEITSGARERYNNLILSQAGVLEYGRRKDFGITPLPNGNYRITAEAQEYWYSLKLKAEDVNK